MTRATPPAGHLLNETEWHTLRALADVIVPPSEKYGIPGAGDEAIAKTIVKDANYGDKLARLIAALDTLNAMAQGVHGAEFALLHGDQRGLLVELDSRVADLEAAVNLEVRAP